MRDLFFHATAAHPQVAPALLRQTVATLRPFRQYLDQAIRTAETRQFRCELPWEKARRTQAVTLEPQQTRLRLPAVPDQLLLHGWPATKPLPLDQPLMVVTRNMVLHVDAADRLADAVQLQLQGRLLADDVVFWGGQPCALTVTQAEPPAQLRTRDDRPVVPLRPAVRSDDGYWLVDVAGRWHDQDVDVDGAWLHAEAMPAGSGLRVVRDANNMAFPVQDLKFRTEALPTGESLAGDDGLTYRWRVGKEGTNRGVWLQLLQPQHLDGDATIDPRATFCEGEVKEVWTDRRHHANTTLKVWQVDRDNYQLLVDRLPSPGCSLYLPIDLRNLRLQKRALRQLTDMPLPHLQGLLRLCEDPTKVRWPPPERLAEPVWQVLTDLERDGTAEQRRFVQQALQTQDVAILEGPPGSGKTTAICELVLQLVGLGKRVLLCGSTHASIDNVLERLADKSQVVSLRVGQPDRVDSRVHDRVLDNQVAQVVEAWDQLPEMAGFGAAELAKMAERVVVAAANLTCGTTMGIAHHPLLRDREQRPDERPITTMPQFDVLIVDEASKTLIQEFLVPALLAKRWIIVGDVQQLPPFSDREDIVASLRCMVDAADRKIFGEDYQRACLLLFRLLDRDHRQVGMRWLVAESPSCLDHLCRELAEQKETARRQIIRLVARPPQLDAPVAELSVAQLHQGDPRAVLALAADWLLVPSELLPKVQHLLPAHFLLPANGAAAKPWLDANAAYLHRQQWQLQRASRLQRPYRDHRKKHDQVANLADCQAAEQAWLADPGHDWANEVAWRITSLHSLKRAKADGRRQQLNREIDVLMPTCCRADQAVVEIEDIGLPSILEVLQEGIGRDRSDRKSALTLGLQADSKAFADRFGKLKYQHRMHRDLAEFPREVIYNGDALLDANTIAERDRRLGWNFGPFPKRRVWLDVAGREDHGVNSDEVRAIKQVLGDFLAWAKQKGPPLGQSDKRWEVACLAFYAKQEKALGAMLCELTGLRGGNRFVLPDMPVEIVCATVDRFQGREADLVLLSLRNTGRVGFLDSPNRLNVAVTRARQQLLVVGNNSYFRDCRAEELKQLAARTVRIPSVWR